MQDILFNFDKFEGIFIEAALRILDFEMRLISAATHSAHGHASPC
jgi:hypothetical protein